MVAAAGLATLAWLLAASGRPLPVGVSRAIVLAALAVLAWAAIDWTIRAWRGDGSPLATRILLALLAASFVIRFTGLDFELVDHWYNDEGVFRAKGRAINDGDLLPTEFNYGHLPFYLSAFVLWLQSLFPDASAALVRVFYDAPREVAVSFALLRSTSALAGALTTIPVFVIARRLAGLGAATVAGALIAFSSLYNQVAHLVIADVPSGFFAALALMYVARLLDGENLRDYLLAGVAAALAAASKYPAGVSAVGIVAIWVYWRVRKRDFNPLLLWSSLASLATFLLVMPALWLEPGAALRGSGTDLLFGWRQYSGGRWLGLSPDGNLLWYGRQLARNFGAPALLMGLTGWAFLAREQRLRTLAMAGFPVAYLALLASMTLVVHRNLQPVIPILAALLGTGIAGWSSLVAGRTGIARHWLLGALGIVCLVPPAVRTVAWDYSQTRPGTNELTAAWIDANVPAGAGIVKESNTPRLDSTRYSVRQVPLAGALEPPELESGEWEYLILSSRAWGAFFDPANWYKPQHSLVYERYRELQEGLETAAEFAPSWARSGPLLTVYRLDPPSPVYRSRARFRPGDVAHANDRRLAAAAGGPIRYSVGGQAVVFKDYFVPGRYRLELKTRPRAIRSLVRVATADNRWTGTLELTGAAEVELPARAKYLFSVYLPRGGRLFRVALSKGARGG